MQRACALAAELAGPPLPVLLRSLEALRDLRLAADRDDIASRHADLRRLKELLGLASRNG